mgnify:CR=1 FL=1
MPVGLAEEAPDDGEVFDHRAQAVAGELDGAIEPIIFAGRDNLSRWLTTDLEIPAIAGAATALAGGTLAVLTYLLVTRRGQNLFAQTVRAFPPFLIASVAFGLSYVGLLEAFARGAVTIVAPITGTYALWTVVLAALFLRDSEAVSRRLVLAALLIVAGASIVGVTQ